MYALLSKTQSISTYLCFFPLSSSGIVEHLVVPFVLCLALFPVTKAVIRGKLFLFLVYMLCLCITDGARAY